MSYRLDDSTPEDADALAAIQSASIDEIPATPPAIGPDEAREICLRLLGPCAVRVLRGPPGVIGFLAREGEEIRALCVADGHRREGHGRRLLDDAKALSTGRLWLWALQRNTGARQFFEQAGFREVELTDGRRNGSQAADVRLMWEAE